MPEPMPNAPESDTDRPTMNQIADAFGEQAGVSDAKKLKPKKQASSEAEEVSRTDEPQDPGQDHLLSPEMDEAFNKFDQETGLEAGKADDAARGEQASFRKANALKNSDNEHLLSPEMDEVFDRFDRETGLDRAAVSEKKSEFDEKVRQEADAFQKSTTSWWGKIRSFFGGLKHWGESEKQIARVKAEMEVLERGYKKKAATIVEDLPDSLNAVLSRTAGVLERTQPAEGPLAELRQAERELSAEYDRLAEIVAEQGAQDSTHQREVLASGTADEAPTEGPGAELNAVYQRLLEVRQRIQEVKENPPAAGTNAEQQRIQDGIERALDEAEAEDQEGTPSEEESFVLESPLETTSRLQKEYDSESADTIELTEKSKAQKQEEEEAVAWKRAGEIADEITKEEAAKAKAPEAKKKAAEKKPKKAKKIKDVKEPGAGAGADEDALELGPPVADVEPPTAPDVPAAPPDKPPEAPAKPDHAIEPTGGAAAGPDKEPEKGLSMERYRKLEAAVEISDEERVQNLVKRAELSNFNLTETIGQFRDKVDRLLHQAPREALQEVGHFSMGDISRLDDVQAVELARKSAEHIERRIALAEQLNEGLRLVWQAARGKGAVRLKIMRVVKKFAAISENSETQVSELFQRAEMEARRAAASPKDEADETVPSEPPAPEPSATPDASVGSSAAAETKKTESLDLKDAADPAQMPAIVEIMRERGFKKNDPGPTFKQMTRILLERGYKLSLKNRKEEGEFMDNFRAALANAERRGGAAGKKAA